MKKAELSAALAPVPDGDPIYLYDDCRGMDMPQDLTMSDWASMGHKLMRANGLMQWAIGDWAAFGHRTFGTLKELCELNGFNYDYLRRLCSVSLLVKKELRSHKLTWSHHAEVAKLAERGQRKWLKVAVEENLSVSVLRERIAADRGSSDATISDGISFHTISGKLDDVTAFVLGQPAEFWDEGRRTIWKQRLKPLVELYERL